MESTWAEATFKLTTHKEKKDALILSDVDDLTTRVDDAVVTMGNVLASPHIGPIRTEAEEFGEKLSVLQVNQQRVRTATEKLSHKAIAVNSTTKQDGNNRIHRGTSYSRLLPKK